jgi:uncharacterized protein YPO0396
MKLLDTVATLNIQLKAVRKERQDIAQKISATKEELHQWQEKYRALLEEQKRNWEEHAVGQDQENLQ